MKRGRKPALQADLDKRGDPRHNSKGNARQRVAPQFTAERPEPPGYLTPAALAIFNDVAEQLHERGVLAVTDGDALGLLATYSSRLESLLGEAEPDVTQVKEYDRMLRPLLREFGRTPGSRHCLRALKGEQPQEAQLLTEKYNFLKRGAGENVRNNP